MRKEKKKRQGDKSKHTNDRPIYRSVHAYAEA